MKLKKLIILLCFFAIACNSYQPFATREAKKKGVKRIQQVLNVDKDRLSILKQSDSLLFSLTKSLDTNVDKQLINRRIDSFYYKKYTKEELLFILDIDRNTIGEVPIEFIRDKNLSNLPTYDNIEDANKAMDSIFKTIMPKPVN